MKRFFKGRIHELTLAHGTERAFYVDVDDGRWSSRTTGKHFWIPRSVCKIGEANECGWHEVMIPEWFFRKNRIDPHRLCGFVITGLHIAE